MINENFYLNLIKPKAKVEKLHWLKYIYGASVKESLMTKCG